MSKSILQARNINKFFYEPVEFNVLKGIDLDISEGQFVAIMGESGSGKSTLLYILATLDTEYQGELFFDGQPLHLQSKAQLAEFRNLNMGFVFQFHFLLPEFTVLENVLMPVRKQRSLDLKHFTQRADRILERLNIADQRNKRVTRLSGGQQQRVAIARALINQPKLLVADEPTGNLDSVNSKLVLDIFREITSQDGQTLIVVTHDPSFAQQTDRIIRLRDGQIIEDTQLSAVVRN